MDLAFASRDPRSRYQLERVVEDGKRGLHKALKLARGFERQKLGRRQKDARQKNASEELLRLDHEIAALKVRRLQKIPRCLTDRGTGSRPGGRRSALHLQNARADQIYSEGTCISAVDPVRSAGQEQSAKSGELERRGEALQI